LQAEYRSYCDRNGIFRIKHRTLNQKPNPETWSIAQVLHHLIRINTSYDSILEAIETDTYTLPFHGKFLWVVRKCEEMVLRSVQPDRKKKMRTFPIWEPSNSNPPSTIVRDFIIHQQQLIFKMQGAEKWVQQGVVICSPASRLIVYRLEKAFEIITLHEERHLAQMQEILHQLNL
jgi:hypothetical protein